MTRDRALLIFMIILMIAPIMAIKVLAAERSPNDWFALAVEIQREIDRADFEHRTIPSVNAEERRFIRKMLNELSVSSEAKPTAAQGQWLLATKEWVKAVESQGEGDIAPLKAKGDFRSFPHPSLRSTRKSQPPLG